MTTIPTESATLTLNSSNSSKDIWLKVDQTYADKTTRTRLTPTQAVQLAHALLSHALKHQGIPT